MFAQGKNHAGDSFERFGTRFFQVYEYDENPQFPACDPDSDNDGLPDRWEDLYGLNKFDPTDAALDNDVDGLSNKEEFYYGTSPLNPDTDGSANPTAQKLPLVAIRSTTRTTSSPPSWTTGSSPTYSTCRSTSRSRMHSSSISRSTPPIA
ncbi:MAG: hypothetical protein EXS36_06780 [Pedosphaera sp.]|nr:hypothetical protein [Pedosphaera sp.]